MKNLRKAICLLIFSITGISVTNCAQNYPTTFGFVSCETLINKKSSLPKSLLESIEFWLKNNQKLVSSLLDIPTLDSREDWQTLDTAMKNLANENKTFSENNYTFEIESQNAPAFIKIASSASRIRSKLSSQGNDPYQKVDNDVFNERLLEATSQNFPTQQHISYAATQLLLEELNSPLVRPTPTYLYHIPNKPKTCDDNNYLLIQEKLIGYTPFIDINEESKKTFLKSINLSEFYRVMKFANLWDISESNIWIHPDGTIACPDGEKPNNEGHGAKARWKVAIFGDDLGKFKHNLSVGHKRFGDILEKYTPELVAEWYELYTKDPEVK